MATKGSGILHMDGQKWKKHNLLKLIEAHLSLYDQIFKTVKLGWV